MRSLIYILFALLIIIVSSCSGTKNDTQDIVKLKYNKNIEFKYRNVKIVPLETNMNSLLGDIKRIEFIDSLILIQDSSLNLFLFNGNGKFVSKIGGYGEGPSEYSSISSFYVDKKNKYITILDEIKSSLISYDIKGQYISSESIPLNNIKSANYATLDKDGNILINYLISFEKTKAYSFINKKNISNKSVVFDYDPIETEGYMYPFSKHPISVTEKGLDFIMPLSDTIYNFNNEDVRAKYLIETPTPLAPKEEFKTNIQKSYTKLAFEYGRKGFFTGFISIFETPKNILLNYKSEGIILGYYVANKNNLEGNYYLYSEENSMPKVPFFEIIASDGKYFIGTALAQDLLNMKEKIEINDETKNLLTIINELNFDDNPVLFAYDVE